MDVSCLDILTKRLDHLERERRRWRQLTAAAVLCGLMTLGVTKAQFPLLPEAPRPPEASRITLRDKAGRIRAIFETAANDSPILAFYDAKGNERMWLGMAADGEPAISLLSTRGVPQVTAAIKPDGTSGVRLELSKNNLNHRCVSLWELLYSSTHRGMNPS